MTESTPSNQHDSRSIAGPISDINVSTAPTTSISDRQHQLKLTVSRETFLTRLSVAVRGASTRSAIQTLSGILLRVDEGRAELQATDMELGIRVGLEVSDATPGVAVVPGRLLLDVVRSLPQDELTLEYRSSQQDVELVGGPARFHLRTLPPEDFPKLPEAPGEGALNVPAAAFVDTISRVARAASRDETRPHLTGVLVTASGHELRMVATDSYRLSVKETELETELAGSLEANVPARTLQELGRIATGTGADSIGVASLENQVVFSVGETIAWTWSELRCPPRSRSQTAVEDAPCVTAVPRPSTSRTSANRTASTTKASVDSRNMIHRMLVAACLGSPQLPCSSSTADSPKHTTATSASVTSSWPGRRFLISTSCFVPRRGDGTRVAAVGHRL